MMNYKGYIGKVEYDDENKVFTGSVINTRTVITFQGVSVDELEAAFRESIEDYLDWCREDGVEPEKPFSGKFVVRLNPELHQKASIGAGVMGLSLNNFMIKAVQDELKAIQAL